MTVLERASSNLPYPNAPETLIYVVENPGLCGFNSLTITGLVSFI
jgi:hypothetical protein